MVFSDSEAMENLLLSFCQCYTLPSEADENTQHAIIQVCFGQKDLVEDDAIVRHFRIKPNSELGLGFVLVF